MERGLVQRNANGKYSYNWAEVSHYNKRGTSLVPPIKYSTLYISLYKISCSYGSKIVRRTQEIIFKTGSSSRCIQCVYANEKKNLGT